MAHKKGGGSSKNLRNSNAQYRGVKKFDGESVVSGNIIIRQCGTRIHPGHNVGLGRDFTIFATMNGYVKYEPRPGGKKQVSVYETHPNRQ
ncbi:MAG: 50S ribosomal protein L27 [Caldilineae bacterium]|nr:50S ribosomal protein L27 [Chloroflexota bacterium]MCB9176235.1 50S ribosomal protein L27 [Caldilineae bacterium]